MQTRSLHTRTPLPTALPPLQGLDLHARYYSSRKGGDFFDAVAAGPHVVFLLTDIAGTRDAAHSIASAAQDVFRLRVPQLFTTDVINMMDTLGILAREIKVQADNVRISRQATQITLNEYQAGTQAFTAVVTAEEQQLTVEEALLATQGQLQTEVVDLIVALGGGWTQSTLPDVAAQTSNIPPH